jgi:hypothetical protein
MCTKKGRHTISWAKMHSIEFLEVVILKTSTIMNLKQQLKQKVADLTQTKDTSF